MRATVMFGAGNVRIETVPDVRLVQLTDALVVVTRAAICGSDLWPYKPMESSDTGRRMGHEFIGVVDAIGADIRTVKVGGGVAPARAYTEELLSDVLEGGIEPGRVFDWVARLDEVPEGYRAMNEREAIKVLMEF